MENQENQQIRMAVFKWLDSLLFRYPDYVIPSRVLANDFVYKGERIVLSGQQGIWKPKQLDYPISIKSRIDSHYQDEIISEYRIRYKYKGSNPEDWVNVGLRNCMTYNIPLVYMLEVAMGKYLCQWPVFIVDDDRANLTFLVEAGNQYTEKTTSNLLEEPDEIKRKYATGLMLQRLHQAPFRERVLEAYKEHCAMCKLRHRELLDAAHIISDKEGGRAIVTNGLALCKIHHAAFDQNIIGVTPDYIIKVRNDILQEIDGPMLKHGIQELHNNNLYLPSKKNSQPDKGYLEERYDKFNRAAG